MASIGLDDVRALSARERYLAVVATSRTDGGVHGSVVNAGILEHPVTAVPVVAFVTYGAHKLRNLRERPRATLVFRTGWDWIAVEGRTELIGPDDPLAAFDPAGLPQLLRDVFIAAGGQHDDWDTYDRVMAEERRVAVLVHPERTYGVRADDG